MTITKSWRLAAETGAGNREACPKCAAAPNASGLATKAKRHSLKAIGMALILLTVAGITAPPALAQNDTGLSLANAKDAAQIIAMKRRAWESQKRRDPEYFRSLRQHLSQKYVYTEGSNRADVNQYVRDAEHTFLEDYTLSDFSLTFPTPTDAVMTHKAIFKIRGYGKSMVKSCYYTTVLKKEGGVWYEISYVGTPAK